MLIPLSDVVKKYNLHLKGVVHVGAHWAQEHDAYLACGIKKMVYIEPTAKAFQLLQNKFANNPDVLLINCACGDTTGQQKMYTESSNQGQSNSFLKPKLHLRQHPEVVFNGEQVMEMRRLDDLHFNREDYDMLMMDCQGYEGFVLKGGLDTLKNFSVVYTEINKDYLYEGCTLIGELDTLLSDFNRVETNWCGRTDWGDAVYIRK